MGWDDSLTTDQKVAAGHIGSHARLLAGPGTGKTLTLTRRVCFLVTDKNIPAESIVALTFTRAAARELRQRVNKELGSEQSPRISTLHSFALRQLLMNEERISSLPQPFQIADDWEERNIVLEDLKDLLELQRISDVKDYLNKLSSDWQNLTADEASWEERFPDPRFLGAWKEHRKIYSYTLRSELVYQLKKALEQRGDFKFEDQFNHLLVDEYQDLNRCDLEVVKQIASRDVELFVAGDDDQSIYGFRKAHPEGIRGFISDYPGATELELEICKRCDRDILSLGLFVVGQDTRRISKTIRSEPDRKKGKVAILRFDDQDEEAKGIADLCTHLINQDRLNPNDILILLRSDRYNKFSQPIREKLQGVSISVTGTTDTASLLDDDDSRSFLAFLRLAINKKDSLAWRSLFKCWCSGVGSGTISSIYGLARVRNKTFAQTVIDVHANIDILPNRYQFRLSKAVDDVLDQLNVLFPENTHRQYETPDELIDVIRRAAGYIIQDETKYDLILQKVTNILETLQSISIEVLVRAIGDR